MKKSKRLTGVDMISNLPDHILHLILSGLQSTEEVVRTSILATRWRYLWTSIPFADIDYFRGLKRLKEFDCKKFEEFVNRVLANKFVDLDSFRLCCSNYYDLSTVGRWIHGALMRNVKLLHLIFFPRDESKLFPMDESSEESEDEDVEVPDCPVTWDSLVELRLFLFNRPLKLPYFREFQAVRVLELNSVELFYNESCDSFADLINLEDLSLIDCYMCDSTFVPCPNLKNLRIVNRVYGYRITGDVLFYSPKLVFFELAGQIAYDISFAGSNPVKKAVIHREDILQKLSYLDLFGNISPVESLSIGIYFLFQFIEKGEVLPSLDNSKDFGDNHNN